MTLTERIADFSTPLQYEDLPESVVDRTHMHILDTLGVCLLGAAMPFAEILYKTVARSGGPAESTPFGRPGKLPAPLAALFNGGLAHGNEFDDTYAPGRWHGSAATVPAALAVAEEFGSTGEELILAVAAGLEVGCRLTRAAPAMLYRGFHSTSTTGIFSATVAVAKLMGLQRGHVADALGISGGFSGGTMEYLSDPEPWSKRIQVGYANHGAVLATRAASNGFRGPRTILEGKYGYFASHAGEGGYDLSAVTTDLGVDWQLLHLYPKLFPGDALAQGYVRCAIDLASDHDIDPGDVERIECVVHPLVVPVMFEPSELRYRPRNGWSAHWSMPFTIAAALTDRSLTVDSYADERTASPEFQDLMDRVTYLIDDSLNFPADYPALVRISLRSGESFERFEPKVAGSPDNPVSRGQYESKFLRNASPTLGAQQAKSLLDAIGHLPTVTDLREVLDLTRC